MNAFQQYVFISGMFSLYQLGVMHGIGHGGWKSAADAFCLGAAWPVMLVYGVYMAHFAGDRK